MTDAVHLLEILLGTLSDFLGNLLERKGIEKRAFERKFISVSGVNLLTTHVVKPDKGTCR